MQVWIRRCALLLLPLGFLAVMVAAPLLSLAFYDGEGAWAEVVADDYMRLRLGWTVAQAGLACLLVSALGGPSAGGAGPGGRGARWSGGAPGRCRRVPAQAAGRRLMDKPWERP